MGLQKYLGRLQQQSEFPVVIVRFGLDYMVILDWWVLWVLVRIIFLSLINFPVSQGLRAMTLAVCFTGFFVTPSGCNVSRSSSELGFSWYISSIKNVSTNRRCLMFVRILQVNSNLSR